VTSDEPNVPKVPFIPVVQENRGQLVNSTVRPSSTPGQENSTATLSQRVVDET
jgi:hypothetical protein